MTARAAPIEIDLAALEAMAAGGASLELVLNVLRTKQAAADLSAGQKRVAEKLRKRAERARDGLSEMSAGHRVTSPDIADETQPIANSRTLDPQPVEDVRRTEKQPLEQKEIPPTPPKEKLFLSLGDSNLEEVEEEKSSGLWSFDEFWKAYPHKVGKHDAARAFDRVRKSKAIDFTALIAGLLRYAAKTDDRPWCNPATWLNQGRWTDQPATVARAPPQSRGTNGAASLLARLHAQENSDVYESSNDHTGPEIDGDTAPRRHHATAT